MGTLSAALGAYRLNGGRWSAEVTVPLLGGVLLLGITVVFLFGLTYARLWPVFMIAGGLLLLAGSLLDRNIR